MSESAHLNRRRFLTASALGVPIASVSAAALGQERPPAPPDPAATVSVRDLGATGDGIYRPLATRYRTLEAARTDFPFVDSLGQSLDWAAIQAACLAVQPLMGRVLLPAGRYIITDSIRVPNWIMIEGESTSGTIIDNQNRPLSKPQFVNADPTIFAFVTFRNLTCNGGTHFLKVDVTTEVAGLVFAAVRTNLQTEANLEFRTLQTTEFLDCHFNGGRYGIKVNAFPCNSITLTNTRITGHSGPFLSFRGGEGLVMVGGSIEGGPTGRRGEYTMDIEGFEELTFKGVYFESGHEYLLRSRNSPGIRFESCIVNGHSLGGRELQAFKFDCPEDLIEFGSNNWLHRTEAPPNILLLGRNDNLAGNANIWTSRAGRTGRVVSRRFDFDGAGALGLLSFTRTGSSEARPRAAILSGLLTLQATCVDRTGAPQALSRPYRITVSDTGAGLRIATSALDAVGEDGAAPDLVRIAVRARPGPNGAILEASFDGLHDRIASAASFCFEYAGHAQDGIADIAVAVA